MAIISFAHQFVFIKTSKTAGTSIEIDMLDMTIAARPGKEERPEIVTANNARR